MLNRWVNNAPNSYEVNETQERHTINYKLNDNNNTYDIPLQNKAVC